MPTEVIEKRFACDFPGCSKTHGSFQEAEECERRDRLIERSESIRLEIEFCLKRIVELKKSCPHGGLTPPENEAFSCWYCGLKLEEIDPSR